MYVFKYRFILNIEYYCDFGINQFTTGISQENIEMLMCQDMFAYVATTVAQNIYRSV